MHLIRQIPKGVDAVAVGIHGKQTRVPANLLEIDKATGGTLDRLLKLGDFDGKEGSILTIACQGQAKRLILAGLGEPAKGSPQTDIEALRTAAGAVAKTARKLKLGRVVLYLHGQVDKSADPSQIGRALAEGAIMGGWAFEEFKSSPAPKKPAAKPSPAAKPQPTIFEVLEPNKDANGQLAEAVRYGAILATAANYSRTLAARPGNIAGPNAIIQEARQLGKRLGLKVRIINAPQARRLGMGGLIGVGQGSLQQPALVLLHWKGRQKAAGQKPIAIVGKTITFDTGGISIKPAADMDQMKYDKSGGMAVLGVMQAIAELKLPQEVVGVLAVAENAVSPASYRPGDILRMYNGKTVEVTNTDAEGRLILADALSFVAQQHKPQAIIDMATLTGGVVIALGSVYAGLFSSDDKLAGQLEQAGQRSGEWLWRLPMHDRYKALMEGYHGDLVNSGTREASPVQGAIFLREFVPAEIPWAHLDIAGVAHPKKDDRYLAKGPTGFGVRLVVEWLRSL